MPTLAKPDPSILKRPPPRYFTAWSYSRWSDHSNPETGCPRRARLTHLDKLPTNTVESPAMVRGADIHRKAELFVKGEPIPGAKKGSFVKGLPVELENFKVEFAHLRKIKATAEGKWGLDVQFKPVDFMDWNRCWCRVITDVHHLVSPTRARLIDHKTGKVYGTNADQLELAAVAGFAYYPKVTEVQSQLWYLDQGLILPEKEADQLFKRTQLTKLQKKWRERSIPLLTDKKFIPKPGPHCGRCPYSQRAGGPCEFGG